MGVQPFYSYIFMNGTVLWAGVLSSWFKFWCSCFNSICTSTEAKNLWTAPCKVCLMKIDNFADSIQATLLPSVTRGWSVFIFDQWELRFSNKWPIMSMEAVGSILFQYRLGLFLSILYFSDSWLSRYRHFGIGCQENHPLLHYSKLGIKDCDILAGHIPTLDWQTQCIKG